MKLARILSVLLTVGCTAVNSYPDSTDEASVERCRDGIDNDLDGQTDCMDLDCDGFCPEETPALCFDGRDNDGDGRVDQHDARCWPFTMLEIVRCSTINGVGFFINPYTDWLFHAAEVTDMPPPGLGSREGVWPGAVLIRGEAVHDPMLERLEVGIVVVNQPLQGGLTGTVFNGSVWIPDGATQLHETGLTNIMLLPDSRVGVDVWADFAGGLAVSIGDGWAFLSSPDFVEVDAADLPMAEGWYDVEVAVGEEDVFATVTPRGGAPVSLVVERPPEWEEDEVLRLVWAAGGGPDDDFFFGDAVVDRPPWSPCGREEPQLVTGGDDAGGHIGGGALNVDGTIACVATAEDIDGRGVTVWQSAGDDVGGFWDEVRIFDELQDAFDRTLVFDAERSEFRMLAWNRETQELVLATSATCGADWSLVSFELTVEDMPSYLIGPDAEGETQHELLFVDSDERLVRYRSRTGDVGSFELAALEPPPPLFPIVLRPPPELEELGVLGRFHRFMRVGMDLVLVAGPYGDGGGVRLYVETQADWVEIGDPALPGSDRPATFDRWRVTRAAAALFPNETPLDPLTDAGLLLVYSGVGDNACQIEVTCAEPGGASEMYFRAPPQPDAP